MQTHLLIIKIFWIEIGFKTFLLRFKESQGFDLWSRVVWNVFILSTISLSFKIFLVVELFSLALLYIYDNKDSLLNFQVTYSLWNSLKTSLNRIFSVQFYIWVTVMLNPTCADTLQLTSTLQFYSTTLSVFEFSFYSYI